MDLDGAEQKKFVNNEGRRHWQDLDSAEEERFGDHEGRHRWRQHQRQ